MTCPHCGYCSHCGRSNHGYGVWPYYQRPFWGQSQTTDVDWTKQWQNALQGMQPQQAAINSPAIASSCKH